MNARPLINTAPLTPQGRGQQFKLFEQTPIIAFAHWVDEETYTYAMVHTSSYKFMDEVLPVYRTPLDLEGPSDNSQYDFDEYSLVEDIREDGVTVRHVYASEVSGYQWRLCKKRLELSLDINNGMDSIKVAISYPSFHHSFISGKPFFHKQSRDMFPFSSKTRFDIVKPALKLTIFDKDDYIYTCQNAECYLDTFGAEYGYHGDMEFDGLVLNAYGAYSGITCVINLDMCPLFTSLIGGNTIGL